MPPIRLALIVGTRPEAIKIAPIALAAARDPRVRCTIVHTGQHGALFDQALAAFGLTADVRLAVPRPPDPDQAVAAIREAVGDWLARHPPDLVLVQGDTSSALAGALAARDRGLALGHIEAGLRSGDLADPWPEEANRIAIDAVADLLFAPTERALAHLNAERCPGHAEVTGNTSIDALLDMAARLDADPSLSRLDAILQGDRRPLLLVTCHRREAIGAPLEAICAALRTLAERGDVRLLFPVHSNPRIAATVRRDAAHPAITLADPLDYPTQVDAMRRARAILTDSGGIQEEAPALGTPVLVLRRVTERPEALETGNLRMVGHESARIVADTIRLIDDTDHHAATSLPAFLYGDGAAAARILDRCAQYFSTR